MHDYRLQPALFHSALSKVPAVPPNVVLWRGEPLMWRGEYVVYGV